jgi:hypothetical protein
VLGCTSAQGGRACTGPRVNANAPASGDDDGQDDGGTRRPEGLGRVRRRRAHVGEGGGTCKKIIPAWLDGRHHQRRWRGGAMRVSRSPSARRPGRPQRAGGSSFSPWWPRAIVQASVKKGGVARQREGIRRRRGDVEAVEAGTLDDGGAGSSHGWLRPSRRTTFPRATSNSFSPHFSSSSGVRVSGQGNGSPEAARVERVQGVAATASYSGGQHVVRGRQGCAGGSRGAPRRRP